MDSQRTQMKVQAGAPVTGKDFFNRDAELRLLAEKVRDGTHILLSGQRRMGKTSVAKELGRRLQAAGWASLFVDIEDAESPQDVVRDIAKAVQDADLASRLAAVGHWFKDNVEELNIPMLGKVRPSDYAWRQRGEALIEACAHHQPGVLLVLDELPIFLSRLLAREDGTQPAHQFLRWLRTQRQRHAGRQFALVVSGSIGMAPLVARMGIPDSINDLYPFRLGPWDRDHSVEWLRLAAHGKVEADSAVFDAIYDALGLGVPHFVQSFFARLKDYAVMNGRTRLTAEDVQAVYSNDLLGPAGNGDLLHYENRLRESLEDNTYRLAMEIQAEAATQGVYTAAAHRSLLQVYETIMPDVRQRADEALDVLINDGHLEPAPDGGHRLPFRLLRDWLHARFRDHHVPLGQRTRRQQ